MSDNHQLLNLAKEAYSFSDETLNRVLMFFCQSSSIGISDALEYFEIMDSICEVEDPKDAWEEYCRINRIQEDNPFVYDTIK